MSSKTLLDPIQQFLRCETPDGWIEVAKRPENLSLLLIDHMICELKAAQTAMWLLRKYAVDQESGAALLEWLKPYENFIYLGQGSLASLLAKNKGFSKTIQPKPGAAYAQDLIDKMVLLIKEELHHFYQVLELMTARDIPYQNISAGRYAKGMMKHVRSYEPATLVDKLICGAYIEARSCERFAKLAPYLDDELNKFYVSLLRSEARHYQDYLRLAKQVNGGDISERVALLGQIEAELISTTDNTFRFHSGLPELV